MSFDRPAEAYDRFMGRYSAPLADQVVEVVGAVAGQQALDVGCGPGALTTRLRDVLGPGAVAAVDPSPSFVAAVRERCPDVEVRSGAAEDLPWDEEEFDLAVCSLVVHFMADPVAGLREMARVTRPGGRVAATVWARSGAGVGPLVPLWEAAASLWPGVSGEENRPGAGEGELAALFARAGLVDTETRLLEVQVHHPSLEEWWEPYTLGVGPAGVYVAGLDEEDRERLRRRCAERLPADGFDVSGSAWCVVGRVPS